MDALPAFAQCEIRIANDSDALRKGRSLSIRLFSIEDRVNYQSEPIENLRIAMAEKLRDALRETDYFSSVAILPEDKEPQTELVLEGQFTNIDEGNRAARILNGQGHALMVVRGKLLTVSAQKVFEFTCGRATAGGPLGQGGWFAGGGKKLIHSHVENFVQNLKKLMPLAGEKMTAAIGPTRPPIVAKQQPAEYDWREKPPKLWSEQDCLKIIYRFSASSNDDSEGRVHALWLSAPSYQAHLRLFEIMRTNNGNAHLFETWLSSKPEGPIGIMPEGSPRLLFVGPRGELEKEDVYFIEASFNKKSHLYGLRENTAASTFLRHSDRPNERIQPLWDASPSRSSTKSSDFKPHLIRLVFPTKRADGTPVIESLSDKLEIHTKFDGRPVIIHFDLRQFGLSRLEDLKLKSETSMAESPAASSRPRAVAEKVKP
jgi:hypothetical protein